MRVKKLMTKMWKDVLYHVYLGVLSGVLTDEDLRQLTKEVSSADAQSTIYAAVLHAKLNLKECRYLTMDQFLGEIYCIFSIKE